MFGLKSTWCLSDIIVNHIHTEAHAVSLDPVFVWSVADKGHADLYVFT